MENKKLLRTIVNLLSKTTLTNLLLRSLNIDTVFLNYHRVISDNDFKKKNRPSDDLIVSESVFEKQIIFLTKNFNVISINDVHKNLNLKKKIVITFDDGYFDNFEIAFPILKKYNCPAIIYIATSFLNNTDYPWWLNIWKIIKHNEFIIFNEKKIDISNKNLKIKYYDIFCRKLFLLKKSEQAIFFNKLRYDIKKSIKNKKIFLLKENLIKLSKNNLVEIGCHSHHHQNLKILNKKELNKDIAQSKRLLEKITRKKIFHFSIPFGTKDSFTEKTIRLLKKFNFKTIVTTNHGNFNKNELSKIPRVGVGNNDLGDTLYSKAIGFDSFLNKIFRR